MKKGNVNVDKRREMIILQNKNYATYAKKKLLMNLLGMNFIVRFKIPLINTRKCRDAAHSTCTLKYKTTKEIPMVLHNG